ncbi:BREX-1 system adenine-specific DNA-methyltransferase PglX [Geobacter benzoatilyticus]|uniref:site-specific DNA-methyltransferase (adenine-specific) n=1 Tax=Geobacter benzoatilyticus TaxID=2815309 RepID=A0ABX7Q0Q6_9BACT|nr:BREX-1 system adenine-specific DNA-methyltransferase PglX [Geobacter benzoatilyticus]QSV44981.1 BREX-1 system adenine-specific DNA-methyltransferase PglX [Geobacter benzoatilyticus]
METAKLRKFAQYARRSLMEQVAAKMKFVLATDSQARRENSKAVDELERQIRATSQDRVIEKVAYIWFNRFCALRFMDANRYNRVNIISPADPGQFQPEILAEAKMGHIDENLMPDAARQKVFNLLNGSISSRDPQQEAYQLLVVAACNYYNRSMPFMFEKIADYTELLIPNDLLSGNSILAYTREAMTPDVCRDVEVIGWLYQFYISEKKDEVFDGLKKNKKITPENIPAATQLFTPHWIVRYLVENSLGRLWMLNRPNSPLIKQMDYYIKPETPETDFLRISKPEEIKLCDPACGSGHMLTYSYDILYAIYEEEGYDANEIPRLILENNLFGIEIDERAGELAAFALTMKAAKGNPRDEKSNHRRFFRNPTQPNICVLQNILFEDGELKNYMDAVGRDLFTVNLQTMLHQFREADNFGSLIRPEYADAASVLRKVEEKNLTSNLFLQNTHERVLLALKQAEYLRNKYHVVIANPPYMGGRGMNGRLASWVKDNYPDSKADSFAMFIERNLDLTQRRGVVAMITMQSWMFLSSFEKLRTNILFNNCILSMAHLGARAFDSLGGEVVSTTAFVIEKENRTEYKGAYLQLTEGNCEAEKEAALRIKRKEPFLVSSLELRKIPGSPIAYWAKDSIKEIFSKQPPLSQACDTRQGLATSNNALFVREWHEVAQDKICRSAKDRSSAQASKRKWFPLIKGGTFRKWYGNLDHVVNWENDGEEIMDYAAKLYGSPTRTIKSIPMYFRENIGWSRISTGILSLRYYPKGCIFSDAGSCIFFEDSSTMYSILGQLNSSTTVLFAKIISPTLTFEAGQLARYPLLVTSTDVKSRMQEYVINLIDLAKNDWDSYETSCDFTTLPLLHHDYRKPSLMATYSTYLGSCQNRILEVKQLEEKNNLIFVETYSLQDELKPDVPLNEITLTCNPHYRYGGDKNEEELEILLLADTIKEFISYAVGCMFGRYSLDKPGLILANLGETVEDYLVRVPDPTFEPDEDNVIPILDEGWFIDDITERFRKFLKVTFGEEHYEENLRFIEEGLGKKGKRQEIRDYFLKDFYSDHLKRYKKRPIYWLFSSPKGSFNALIYMHRYRPDTASVVLNDYLREFRTKLSARKQHLEQVSISASASPREKTDALKNLEKLRKVIDELEVYERETLYPLATKQIPIDLDNGVKFNYLLFGDALKKIPGLDAGEE